MRLSRHVTGHCRFNLVELVMILTTLISLASLLLPVVYRGSLQAKSILCSSNLSKIGTWTQMYAHANDGYLPAYEDGWVGAIAVFGEKKVDVDAAPAGEFSCPSQPFTAPPGAGAPGSWWRGTSFGINQHIASSLRGPYGDPLPMWSQANVKKIRDPSQKALAADATGSNYFGVPDRDPVIAGVSPDGETYADSLPPDPARVFPFLRHLDGTGNFLLLDGHVEVKESYPTFMLGPGTSGYDFWHAEHWYPGSGMAKPDHLKSGGEDR